MTTQSELVNPSKSPNIQRQKIGVPNYILDTNVFIQAEKSYYPFDFCPAFRDWLTQQNQSGMVASVSHVCDELCKGKDDLANWAKSNREIFFVGLDESTNLAINKISDWANRGNYQLTAVSDFLDSADYWLIAYALTHKCIIVTHEKYERTSRRIKIPNACEHFSIEYTDTFTMLRREKAKFILDQTTQ